ncbi:response regulator transcription factor [Alsobacter ponti]
MLLIEDEPLTRESMALYLRSEGMDVQEAQNLADAGRKLSRDKPDVAVVDIMLGDGSGFDLIKSLSSSGVGIIVVSARGSALDRVLGLELGADDYVTKPVEPRELALRIRKLHARMAPAGAPGRDRGVYEFAGFELDTVSQTLRDAQGHSVELTGAQFRLLELLAQSPNRVFERDAIAEHIHGRQWIAEGRAVDVLVSKLRSKIDPPNAPSLIRSVRGVGYLFATEVRRKSVRAE